MKRNWEIIRTILTRLEDSETPNTVVNANQFDYPEQEVAYNIRLLKESGFIVANIAESHTGDGHINSALARSMTNSGHELLDTIRNDNLWGKIKEKFKSNGVEMTFYLVLTVGKTIAQSLLQQE